ncbi:MAG: hypothetical protein M3Z08_03190 [Chloroflexota bacterium]|nr:hypothetical protein [Chloroflexota bacterium]
MPETTNTPEHTTASPDQKTYQINPPFIVPVLSGSYAFIAIVVLLEILIKQGFSLFRVLIACLILLGIAIFTFVMARLYGIARLTSSPDGLIYYSLYYTLYTPWDNISRIVNLPRTGGTGDALQLRDAATRMPIVQGIREHCPAIVRTQLPLSVPICFLSAAS